MKKRSSEGRKVTNLYFVGYFLGLETQNKRSARYALPFTNFKKSKLTSDLARAAEGQNYGLWSKFCHSWLWRSKKTRGKGGRYFAECVRVWRSWRRSGGVSARNEPLNNFVPVGTPWGWPPPCFEPRMK